MLQFISLNIMTIKFCEIRKYIGRKEDPSNPPLAFWKIFSSDHRGNLAVMTSAIRLCSLRNMVCMEASAGFSVARVSPALNAPATTGMREGPEVASLPPLKSRSWGQFYKTVSAEITDKTIFCC
jgi:hypothetical protein